MPLIRSAAVAFSSGLTIYAKPNICERTADYYNRYITKHIVPCLGDIKLNKLTGRQIQKMYNDLLDHGRERVSQKEKNPGLSGTYVHGVHVMLHNCLNRAVKERLLVRNPADDVIVPKIDKKEMKILPPEQVKAYLKAASARGILPLFYLELTSGLRKGEIAALLWSDLDVENCTLSVTKQLVSSRDGELKITATDGDIRKANIPAARNGRAAQGRTLKASAKHIHVSIAKDRRDVPSGFDSKAARENFE